MKNGLKQRVLPWLLGSRDKPYQYTHHAVLLIGSVVYLYCAVANYAFQLASLANVLVQLALVPIILFIWYLSRWLNYFKSMAVLFMLLVTLVSLPINWIGNGGYSGPTYFLNLGVLIYISVAFRDLGLYRRLGQALAILMPVPLLMIERRYPDIIFNHETADLLQLDLTISFVATGFFLMLMMENYSRRFKLERDKATNLSVKLQLLSEQDPLTGLSNRRVLEPCLDRWRAEGRTFCLALIDLDHFKSINDQWGHNYGDEVLCAFAKVLHEVAKQQHGQAIRLGGEEFVLLLPLNLQTTFDCLIDLANEFKATQLENGVTTFSAGVAQMQAQEENQALLKRADDLMYDAKRAGRDCIKA
ncbi:GGDEF domain-containing protein [Marinomonas aquiplantarum]|uniref:diguanylate cyclase n=1 Tax=Marinomonas aquiplantarum TaxID=491951 RepID=A0A366CT64_9GAMM|nr:GGDEF domain-containing protein [Marinomonas aquiplantarum]RBO78560.1 diguanylate cyclase (GGDEF)-like protein [Marinomonas aquiplantarum]